MRAPSAIRYLSVSLRASSDARMPACTIRSTIAAATGACSSEIGSTRTCSGASHVGNAPAKCSIRIAMNRSNEPLTAR